MTIGKSVESQDTLSFVRLCCQSKKNPSTLAVPRPYCETHEQGHLGTTTFAQRPQSMSNIVVAPGGIISVDSICVHSHRHDTHVEYRSKPHNAECAILQACITPEALLSLSLSESFGSPTAAPCISGGQGPKWLSRQIGHWCRTGANNRGQSC